MRIKLIFVFALLLSCSNNEEALVLENLQDQINSRSSLTLDEVIACAASKKGDNTISHIYYYPLPEATNIQYFETASVNVDPNNYTNYNLKQLPDEDVFGGYLKRFIRTGTDEVYTIVTFETNGRFHKSNPIRLKNITKPTEYNDEVSIDFSESLMPTFSWNDGLIAENAIYFQVISDSNNNFISGTYTFEKTFQYYKISNVVLDINRSIPDDLKLNEPYNFSMLGVSLDNWVNLFIEEKFTAN